MKEKSIIQTNPNLKDPIKLEKMIYTNVVSSTAIELVNISPEVLEKLRDEKAPAIIWNPFKKIS